MVPVHSALHPLHLLRRIPASSVYGKRLSRGADDRQAVFMDTVAFLFCGFRQTGCRRHPSRHQRHEAVYDGNLYRPDPSCRFVLRSVRYDKFRDGHLVFLAHRLEHRHRAVCLLLQEKVPAVVPPLTLYHDLCFGLRIVADDLPHARYTDTTRQGVFDTHNRCGDHCLHIRLFKTQIRIVHLAVYEF